MPDLYDYGIHGAPPSPSVRCQLPKVQRPAAVLAAWLNAPDLPAGASKVRGTARHTHATHALARGAELTTVRDKLRHASIASPDLPAERQGQAGIPDESGVRRALARGASMHMGHQASRSCRLMRR